MMNDRPADPYADRVIIPLPLQLFLAVFAVLLVWLLSNVILLITLAALLALVLRGSADWLAPRVHLPGRLVLALLTLGTIALAVVFGYWSGPKLVQQAQELVSRLVSQYDALRAVLNASPWGKPILQMLASTQITGARLVGPATSVLWFTFSMIAGLVLLFVTLLYFASSPQPYVNGLLHLVPLSRRRRAREVLEMLGQTLRLWVLGQLVDMLTVGGLAAIGLSVLGVPDPYALAILAGLFTFVPYFGAIIAGIPAVVIAMTVSWETALWTLAVYVGCHIIEGYIVAPLVQAHLVELPPAVCILGMAVTGTLFGPLGIVLGTPLAAIALVLVREVYVRDLLGDEGV